MKSILSLSLALLQLSLCNGDCNLEFSMDEVVPAQGQDVGTIRITDAMIVQFDVTINSFPSSWGGIIRCGASNAIRQPGVWLHPNSDDNQGFYVSYSNVNSNDPAFWTNIDLVTDHEYAFELRVTQSTLTVTVDGNVVKNMAKPNHNTYDSAPCYVSDPEHGTSDSTVRNLRIWSISDDDQECGRDCSDFAFDEYLTQCSEQYPLDLDGIAADINQLRADLEGEIDSIRNTEIDAKIDAAKTELQQSIDANASLAADNKDRLDTFQPMSAAQAVQLEDPFNGYSNNNDLFTDNKDLLLLFSFLVNIIVLSTSLILCCKINTIHKSNYKYQKVRKYATTDNDE